MNTTKITGEAVALNSGQRYHTTISAGKHVFVADEPEAFGGKGDGPAPIDYLCAALASCKAITIQMYVQRKGWVLHHVDVKVTFVKSDQMASGNNTFYCHITLDGEVNEEQKQRILAIAKACPVDRLLRKPSDIVTLM
jgi:putative redox protein